MKTITITKGKGRWLFVKLLRCYKKQFMDVFVGLPYLDEQLSNFPQVCPLYSSLTSWVVQPKEVEKKLPHIC
jgi:hypothetical protein